MPGKPFDASLKDVIEAHAADWARLLGALHPGNVRVIDADVSTVTGAADKALLVESENGDYIIHPELQSSYNPELPERTWWYSSVYHHRLRLAVLSTVVLLRPQADGPAMSGHYEVRVPTRPRPYHVFEYDVLRLWQVPVDTLLAGGVGILPIAPLADHAAGELPEVVRAIDKRLNAEADREQADKLRAATTVLMGLRHSQDIIDQALKGLWPMWDHVLEDSSVIQEFVRRGEKRGVKIGEERANARLRNVLLHLGQKQFGSPDAATRAIIDAIADPDRLAALSERVLEVKSWQELLG